ncbi:HXXEE domain-containing protein [Clostridium pasteurianum]|uniref:HXXEE domain-containing protein n=1 Tax=Clostridium pasteurianum TaxID=1501 RepID=UPI001111E9E5
MLTHIKCFLLKKASYLAVTLHMILLHMLMCIRFKGYVPGVISSVIFVLPSIWFLFKAEKILHYSVGSILFACLIAVILTVIIITTLHNLMGYLSKLIYKYSEVKK